MFGAGCADFYGIAGSEFCLGGGELSLSPRGTARTAGPGGPLFEGFPRMSPREGWIVMERAMRNRLLGTIAAVAAGAGMAWGQTPGPIAPPMPIAPGGIYPASGMEGIPAPMGMSGPGMGADPNGVFPGGMPPGGDMGGMPPGLHGQQQWQQPFSGMEPQGVNGRLAPSVWLTTDYMLAFAKAQPTAYPFVTSSAPAAGGILGATSTNVLHSNSDLGYNLISGVRFNGGFFRDDARRFGYYASGFFTEQ